jgi:hypothetical protein
MAALVGHPRLVSCFSAVKAASALANRVLVDAVTSTGMTESRTRHGRACLGQIRKLGRHCEEAVPTKQSSEKSSGSPRRYAARDDEVLLLAHEAYDKPL